MTEQYATLEELAAAVRTCTLCGLSQSRTNAVPGDGSSHADIMFVGEGPGFHEDRQALPFVGAAGRYLDELLASIGVRRQDVYITNVIKCRPPGNRDPFPNEIEACRPYLERQIELIQPRMIVTLGRFSLNLFFPETSISQAHGRPRKVRGIVYYPIYHPAAGLHQPRWKSVIEQDFRRIPDILARIDQLPDEEPPSDAEQLSLF